MSSSVSITLLKGLGAGNELISLTSFLQLPWVLKLLWAPMIERFGTKRRWILLTQSCLAALFCPSGAWVGDAGARGAHAHNVCRDRFCISHP